MSTQYPKRSLLQLYNDSEFLAEHFGFLPIEVLDELYNAYNFVFYRANEALETYIKSLSAEPDHEVEKVCDIRKEKWGLGLNFLFTGY